MQIAHHWKNAQQNEPQNSLLPEDDWHGPCLEIWLVIGGAPRVAILCNLSLKTMEIK